MSAESILKRDLMMIHARASLTMAELEKEEARLRDMLEVNQRQQQHIATVVALSSPLETAEAEVFQIRAAAE